MLVFDLLRWEIVAPLQLVMGIPIRLAWVCLSFSLSEWGFSFFHLFLLIYPEHPIVLFQIQWRAKQQYSSELCSHEHNTCIVSHPEGRVSFITITSLPHFNEACHPWDPWGLLFWPTYTFIATLRNLLTYCIYFFFPDALIICHPIFFLFGSLMCFCRMTLTNWENEQRCLCFRDSQLP